MNGLRSSLSDAAALIEALRRLTMAVLLFGLIGTATELLLLKHYEDVWQLPPLILIAAGLAIAGWQLARPSRTSLRLLRLTMVAFVVSGAAGVALHYQGSLAFQLELDPTQSQSELFWKVMRAQAPPALAPALMAQLGLLGLIYGYRYPASGSGEEWTLTS